MRRTRFHGHIRSWMFDQLDPGCGYKPVRRPPLRAYAGWWDEMQADEVPESRAWWSSPNIEHAPECRHCGGEIPKSVTDTERKEFCSSSCKTYYDRWVDLGRPREKPRCVICGLPHGRWGETTCCGRCKMEETVQARPRHRAMAAAKAAATADAARREQERANHFVKVFQAKWDTLDAIPPGGSIVTCIDYSTICSWIHHGNGAKVYKVGNQHTDLFLVVRDPQPDKLP